MNKYDWYTSSWPQWLMTNYKTYSGDLEKWKIFRYHCTVLQRNFCSLYAFARQSPQLGPVFPVTDSFCDCGLWLFCDRSLWLDLWLKPVTVGLWSCLLENSLVHYLNSGAACPRREEIGCPSQRFVQTTIPTGQWVTSCKGGQHRINNPNSHVLIHNDSIKT